MNYRNVFLGMAVLGLLTLLTLYAATSTISEAEAEAIGVEAYIYGYPLVTMEMTRAVSTNVEAPAGSRAPMGQFANLRTYPNASFTTVTAPNADTLYSVAWLDLTQGAYILHVPDEEGRYYLMPILSGWTDVIASPGTRTTGTEAANFAITGPNWKGNLPNNVKEFKCPTNMAWILGRTYCTGTPEDYMIVHAIQDAYQLTLLNSKGNNDNQSKGTINPHLNIKVPVRQQVNSLSGEAFFNKLALLLVENPPSKDDGPIIDKMAKIGLVPGQKFQNSSDGKIAAALERAPELAQKKIADFAESFGKNLNGWEFSLNTGNYGSDYLRRAFVTAVGLGANLPQDAVYPMSNVDSEGQQLNGSNKYVIHFDKGQEPPVKGFWSLTMYNDKFYFVDNPINRYSLNSHSKFIYNPDGSLDILIQNAFPGSDKEANWLPAPTGEFALMLRTYWPEEPILKGEWIPPAIQKVKTQVK